MLKEMVEKKRYSFYESFDMWEDAVRAACSPLINENIIEKTYIEAIIDNIKTFGPYIILAPMICIPHAQSTKGVNENAISFMRVKKPVNFSRKDEHKAHTFFVIAAMNSENHMAILSEMCNLIKEENILEKMMNINCENDLGNFINDYNISI
ncbi:MAG: PTS sugar transporter subunit IIA [Sarcina sp.]